MKYKSKKNNIPLILGFIIIVIIVIIVIIIIGLYYIKTQKTESFIDITGTGNNQTGGYIENNCNIGSLCQTSFGEWGIYSANCECISNMKTLKNNNSEKDNSANKNNYAKVSEETLYNNYNKNNKYNQKDPSCIDNSSDFNSICKNKNENYYAINLIPCDIKTSKPVCGPLNDNDDLSITTPCLNKSDDFNTWCRYYSNGSNIPGYNVNSVGAKKVLVGAEGGCYTNGRPDNSKGRGICAYDYTDEVVKLEAANKDVNYNAFTECRNMKDTDFIKECAHKLKLDYKNTYATQITSYDCNPGYARAKCLNNKDKLNYPELSYPVNTTTNSSSTRRCTCTT